MFRCKPSQLGQYHFLETFETCGLGSLVVSKTGLLMSAIAWEQVNYYAVMPWTFLHKELFQPKWHWCYLLRNMVLECKGRKMYRTPSFPLRHFPASEEVRSINNARWVMIRAKLDYVDNFSIPGNRRRIVGR